MSDRTNIDPDEVLREKILTLGPCIGPYDTPHRCSAMHCDHCGICDISEGLLALIQSELEGREQKGSDTVELRLVPVEVFGAGRCPTHGSDADGNNPTRCSECGEDVEGYGLCDAVSSWSDCNRAEGKIYRIDDSRPQYREPGETVEIIVRKSDLPFFDKNWSTDAQLHKDTGEGK